MATYIEYINGKPIMRNIEDYMTYQEYEESITVDIENRNITIKNTTYMRTITYEYDIDDPQHYQIVGYQPELQKIIFDIDIAIPGTPVAKYYQAPRIVIGHDDRIWHCIGLIKNAILKDDISSYNIKQQYRLFLQANLTPTYGVLGHQIIPKINGDTSGRKDDTKEKEHEPTSQ